MENRALEIIKSYIEGVRGLGGKKKGEGDALMVGHENKRKSHGFAIQLLVRK